MEWDDLKESIKNTDTADVNHLLKYARRLLKAGNGQKTGKRVAVLGTCSIQYFAQILRCLLLRDGFETVFYEGDYDGIRMDVLDDTSPMYAFRPEIVVLLPDYRDIKNFPPLFSSPEEISGYITDCFSEISSVWEHIHKNLPEAQVITANYVVPVERALGNLEANYGFSRRSVLQELNLKMGKEHPGYVAIVDLEYQAALRGKLNWFDEPGYMLNKTPFALTETGRVAELFAKVIGAYWGKARKCLVLDLDNTLWGGVVSEEGPLGIKVGSDDTVGEAYLAFQKYLKALNERGVILAVCSKNDLETAQEPFTMNPHMVLKLENFASFHANWEDKAENIRQIAGEINIGLDSIVFFDDNPAEQEIVRMSLPEVLIISVPEEPAEYARALELSNAFCWASLTEEDLARAGTYGADSKRRELQQISGNYNDYLTHLEMRGKVEKISGHSLPRFSQLINKSNQFNLRTVRYTEAEIEALNRQPDVEMLAAILADKFSNYGIVSCVILKKMGKECFIDTWVMSCRVLKRGLEYMVFQKIYETAVGWGCECIKGEYIPTKKNGMVQNLLADLGFARTETDGNGCEKYVYLAQTIPELNYYIAEEEKI